MRHVTELTPEFVEYIPQTLAEGTLYVSMRFATAAHRCCCGCGNEVVTPLSPTDWTLIFDGESISLDPSIGNWDFKCQSHYWITRNRVEWARKWSQREVAAGRRRDRLAKQRYYEVSGEDKRQDGSRQSPGLRKGVLQTLKEWWSS